MVLTSLCMWRRRESATDPLTIAVEKWEKNLQKAKCSQDYLPFLLSNLEFVEKARILFKVATQKGLPDRLFQHPDGTEKIGCQLHRAGQSDVTRLRWWQLQGASGLFWRGDQIRIGTHATGSGVNVPAVEAAAGGAVVVARSRGDTGQLLSRGHCTPLCPCCIQTNGETEAADAFEDELDNLRIIFEEKDNMYACRSCRAHIWSMDVLNEIEDEEEFSWEAWAGNTEAGTSKKKLKLW
ncbi:uncharacterized protein NFIA_095780 [Aspergillus fischeri NRRL 181]|uniref:Uncharacterized protein n=1 Tax=Neosartorya fischeri (strain ATCC 1020 / DSM 3700 / CBS 544.65 / FGSC A1164 / JCM 1740 / NRRL 181 / WB 181) TaxID=331117 RepID=A1DAR8_NEOFI|nr:uncharacterized protein NFIA_095780 [Aspergillus fischeri NRRL 181]EAW19958.1 hypothetical protein NFIA_095780 [Aspergillus fischeri NRRL 181]